MKLTGRGTMNPEKIFTTALNPEETIVEMSRLGVTATAIIPK